MAFGQKKDKDPEPPGVSTIMVGYDQGTSPAQIAAALDRKARNPEEAAWQQQIRRERGESQLAATEAELGHLDTTLDAYKRSYEALYASADEREAAGRPATAREIRERASEIERRYEHNMARRAHVVDEIDRQRRALRKL